MAVRPKPTGAPAEPSNKDESAVDKIDTRRFIERVLSDIGNTTTTKQMLLGTSSGWLTGQIAMRTGKVVAFVAGSSIILLQVAHQTGYIKINWDKIFKRLDKVSDKVEEAVTGSGPSVTEKVERYVDRKIETGEKKVKSLYERLTGKDKTLKLENIHTFVLSFAAGVALGIATS